nr:tyrosine-type recombinase/integrase [Kitasatospora atroaurantiaca]
MGPDPRVIADDIWAKLLWAGLNVEPGDLPTSDSRTYPVELIRGITLTWLFAGQRSDEIARLRVGCIRWQHDGLPIPGDSGEVLACDAVCLLDVPTHKTGTVFTKPVDPLLGKAIEAWQAVRPAQPQMLDHKTGELADFLFAHRARRVAKHYINTAIIPMLCRKAGVPTADVRGNITSHRARSTIASQLYNAKEPMTLFELQEWLGHRTPEATAQLREDHSEHLGQGLQRRRILRPERPHHRGPRRPRRRRLRRRRQRRTLAVLRPGPRLVHLHLLRTVPAPDGLRALRLLHPEELQQGPTAGGEGEPPEDAGQHPPHRS